MYLLLPMLCMTEDIIFRTNSVDLYSVHIHAESIIHYDIQHQ